MKSYELQSTRENILAITRNPMDKVARPRPRKNEAQADGSKIFRDALKADEKKPGRLNLSGIILPLCWFFHR